MNTERRMVFEVPPPSSGTSSEAPVEHFARRRRGPAGEVIRGVDLIPVGEAHSARQSTGRLAEVFADPDRSEEQDAFIQIALRDGESYSHAYDRLRAEAFAARNETNR